MNLDHAIAGKEPWIEDTIRKAFFPNDPITLVIKKLRKSKFLSDEIPDIQIQRVVVWSFHRASGIRKKENCRDRSTSKADDRNQITNKLSRLATEIESKSQLFEPIPPQVRLAPFYEFLGKKVAQDAASKLRDAIRIIDNSGRPPKRAKRGEKRSKSVEKELVESLAQGWRRLGIPCKRTCMGRNQKHAKGRHMAALSLNFARLSRNPSSASEALNYSHLAGLPSRPPKTTENENSKNDLLYEDNLAGC